MRIGFYLGKVQRATHGGGHTFEVNFIDSLLKYETNHEIYVYYDSKGGNAFESTDRVKFINLRKEAKGFYFIPYVKKNIFSKLVERDKIDFVYYCTPKFATLSRLITILGSIRFRRERRKESLDRISKDFIWVSSGLMKRLFI